MALATSTIQEGRWGVTDMRSSSNVLAGTVSEIRNLLNSNPDYATFVETTQLGQDLNTKLLVLLDTIDGTIVSSINSLTGKIDGFLNRQEELNQKNI